jgi:hypothetical protein
LFSLYDEERLCSFEFLLKLRGGSILVKGTNALTQTFDQKRVTFPVIGLKQKKFNDAIFRADGLIVHRSFASHTVSSADTSQNGCT